MKKIYTLIALAAMTGMTAVAAPKMVKRDQVPQTISDAIDVKQVSETSAKKSATRSLTSLEEIYGNYSGSGVSQLQTNYGDTQYFNFTIGPSSKGGNYVTISNFIASDDLEATVDLAAGTISIAPFQDAWLNSNYPDAMVQTVTGTYDGGAMEPAVGYFTEEGIEFGEEQLLGFGIQSSKGKGYFYLWKEVTLKHVKIYSYDASEWIDCDPALFQDGWVNTIFEEGSEYIVAPQEVKLQKSKTTQGLYILVRPYGGTAWSQINGTPNAPGYIMFNASNKDCICVMPCVPSGMSAELIGMSDESFLMYNEEGFNLWDGWDQADQVEYNQEIADSNNEDLKDYLSYMDENGKIKIINGYFGITSDPLAFYGWQDKDEQSIPIVSYITLPASELAAVNEVLVDSNAPVKYFNLQGMEIANPEAGQLVIVKKGNKASKVIVK